MNFKMPSVPYDDATSRCPMQFLAECRRDMPVLKLTSSHPDRNMYLISRAEDVLSVIADAETFSSQHHPQARRWGDIDAEVAAIYRNEGWPLVNPVVWCDGQTHARFRRLIDKAFLPKRLNARAGYIQGLIDRLMDRFDPGGEVELVSSFTGQLPALVMTREFGLPEHDADLLIRSNDSASRMIDVSQTDRRTARADILAGVRALIGLQHHLFPRIEQVLREPEDNLFSDVVNATADGEPVLTTQEILSLVPLLLIAGVHTTGGMLGWTAYMLATWPELQARLKAQPEKIGDFVEETLRYHGPVPTTYRSVMKDVEIRGVPIPKGSYVVVRWDSTNFDEQRWSNPDAFDIDRPKVRNHHTFGSGIHYCIGNFLARRELNLATQTLLRRYDHIELAVPVESVQPISSFDAHILAKLPLKLRRIRPDAPQHR
jgi:cytochrome P450 family 142 subfamily A polypeptide 1